MNVRERLLLILLTALLLGGGGGVGAYAFVIKPYLDTAKRLDAARLDLEAKEGDLVKERRKQADLVAANPRLGQWKRLSVPESPARDQKSMERHQEKMQEEYRRYLTELLRE